MKPYKLINIEYTKQLNENETETTRRAIIPTFVPQQNIKAIDVTDLPEDKQDELLEYLTEYNEYVKERQKQIFKFEDWLEHSKSVYIEPKWRTFKIENTEEL